MQQGVHEAPLYHEHEHMYHELMPADSRWRLLRFPIPIELDRQRHSCNFYLGLRNSCLRLPASKNNYDCFNSEIACTERDCCDRPTACPGNTLQGPARRTGTPPAQLPCCKAFVDVVSKLGVCAKYPQNYGLENGVDDDGWVNLIKMIPLPLFDRASATDIKKVVKENDSTNKARFKYVAWQGDSVAVI